MTPSSCDARGDAGRKGSLLIITANRTIEADPDAAFASITDRVARRFAYRSITDDGNPSHAEWTWNVTPSGAGCAVAVAADLVAHAVENQRSLAQLGHRLKAFLQLEVAAFLSRPKGRRHHALRAEPHVQSLLPLLLVGEAEARQIQDERQRGRADAQFTDEVAAGSCGGQDFCQLLAQYFSGRAELTAMYIANFRLLLC